MQRCFLILHREPVCYLLELILSMLPVSTPYRQQFIFRFKLVKGGEAIDLIEAQELATNYTIFQNKSAKNGNSISIISNIAIYI